MKKLVDEYNNIKEHNFTLDFIYPNKSERETMNIINRDMSIAQQESINKRKDNMMKLISGLENGEIYLEDLGQEAIERLKFLLNRKE